MPKGIKIPFSINPSGGIATSEKEEQNSQIIKTALSDGDNNHAWQQDLALGIDMIFDINDPVVLPRILFRIDTIFEKFRAEKRFKLLKDTISWDQTESENGDFTLSFKYIDLESDEEETFKESF